MFPNITREQLGCLLSASLSTRTVKSDYLKGTIYDEWEVTDDWEVSYICEEPDLPGIIRIEVCPVEYRLCRG